MAEQICPKCNNPSFYWSMNEELTRWYCHECKYEAYENEVLERVCSFCKRKTEGKMKDNQNTYWWCSTCNNIKNTEE